MELCNCTAIVYSFNLLSTSLLMYLDALKFCNCREIESECLERKHTVTSFHNLAYDKFCDLEKFDAICGGNTTNVEEDVARQCLQISQYERGVLYDEWFIGWSPFCSVYGFGASQRSYNASPNLYSPYNNMTPNCRIATIISMVIFYLLAVAIIVANLTVLLVVRFDQYFHTPYGYFKASIAVADLLVGVLVIPALMYQLHVRSFQPLRFRNPGEFPDLYKRHSPAFFISVGFFTILSLSVSVYCLAASSFDRYFSISQPFKYEAKRFLTRKKSLLLIFAIWLLSAFYGLFPLITPSTSYGMVSATYILASEVFEQNTNHMFPWESLFNSNTSTENLVLNETILNQYKDIQGRAFVSVDTLQSAFPDAVATTAASESPNVAQHKNISSTSKGMYLILCMYLFSLFVPLVLVWIVNICTIQAFKKKNEKSKHSPYHQMASRCRIESVEHNHSSSSPCLSTCTSVTSIQAAMNEDSAKKQAKKFEQHVKKEDKEEAAKKKAKQLEQHVQKKLENKTNNNQFLTVPSVLNHARSSLPNILTHKDPNPDGDALPRPSSVRSSFSIFGSGAIRRKVPKQSGGQAASRMQKILLRMVIAFTICLFPAICTLVLHILLAPYTDPYKTERYSSDIKLFQNGFAYISSVFLFGNSFVNCIIYTVLGKRFRDVTRKLYAGKISQIQSKFRRMSMAIDLLRKNSFAVPEIVEHRV